MNDIGHNSVSKDQLKSIIERVERLEEDKAAIVSDIKDIYGEAKGNGYDTKALRAIVRYRKEDAQDRADREAIFETYLNALGPDHGAH